MVAISEVTHSQHNCLQFHNVTLNSSSIDIRLPFSPLTIPWSSCNCFNTIHVLPTCHLRLLWRYLLLRGHHPGSLFQLSSFAGQAFAPTCLRGTFHHKFISLALTVSRPNSAYTFQKRGLKILHPSIHLLFPLFM